MANEGKGPAFAVAMIVAMGCAFANHDGGKCAGEKKEWKNSSEKSLKKLKKLVDNQGDLTL